MTDSPGPNTDAFAAVRAALDAALAARDRAGAVSAALDAVRDGTIDIAALYTYVLGPLLVDTGAAWQQGTERVWEEHFASATVRTIVEALYPDVVRAHDQVACVDKRVLLACPAGEQHDLGLRMVADRFALAGWDVDYLGPDTPTEEIIDAAQTLDSDLVVLSASTHFNRVLLREVVDEVQLRLPGVRLAVGGAAFVTDAESYRGLILDEAAFGLPACRLPDEV
jgi:MerR family transcriptional regulator, light-induced transcriptional regulator